MRSKIVKLFLAVFISFFVFQAGDLVKADDNEHESYEHGVWGEEEDDDDEEEQQYSNGSLYETNLGQNSLWNIWSREASVSSNENLPFQNAREVKMNLNKQSETVFVVPQNGQLLVSGKKMAKLFHTDYKFYQESKILKLSKGNEKIIVHSGSNATYENMVKTPMPANAFFYEKTIYLPLSVVANAFGYRVSWDAVDEKIILKEFINEVK